MTKKQKNSAGESKPAETPQRHKRLQTAEGWKRGALKAREERAKKA